MPGAALRLLTGFAKAVKTGLLIRDGVKTIKEKAEKGKRLWR